MHLAKYSLIPSEQMIWTKNTHNRHPIAYLWRWAMGVFCEGQSLTDVLYHSALVIIIQP